jgi:hypothetical protein
LGLSLVSTRAIDDIHNMGSSWKRVVLTSGALARMTGRPI